MQGRVVVLRHEENEWHEYPAASPDGRWLAFTVARLDSNVWIIERF